MKPVPPPHVVIVNWNGRADVLACLESLFACDPGPGPIHVVDNGSRDGSVEALRDLGDRIVLREEGVNHGFARGANLGIADALDDGAEAVLLMNNDATADPGLFAAFEEARRRHPEAGLYGPRIFANRAAGALWCCGVALGGGPNLCRLLGHGRRDAERWRRPRVVESLTGCGLLVGREVFERVGRLDERYFVYVEDTDFCARATSAGFSCRYVPDAIVEHAGAGSSGGGYSALRKYLCAHGAVRFLRDHGTLGLWASWVVFDLLALPALLVIGSLRGRAAGARAKARGLLDGVLGRAPRCPGLEIPR